MGAPHTIGLRAAGAPQQQRFAEALGKPLLKQWISHGGMHAALGIFIRQSSSPLQPFPAAAVTHSCACPPPQPGAPCSLLLLHGAEMSALLLPTQPLSACLQHTALLFLSIASSCRLMKQEEETQQA